MPEITTSKAAQDKNMITHYGLFWSEGSVFWGRQRNPGQLLGRIKPDLDRRGASTKEERENERDFRDFVGIYCLYGGGELLYVGEAGLGTKSTLFKRLKDHRKGPMSGRWDKFSWFGCQRLEEREESPKITHVDALAQLEAILISITNPRFNKQSGTFAKAVQVFQATHDEADGDIADKLKKMEERMEKMLKEIKETLSSGK